MSDHYCCKRCGLRYDDCTCPPAPFAPRPASAPTVSLTSPPPVKPGFCARCRRHVFQCHCQEGRLPTLKLGRIASHAEGALIEGFDDRHVREVRLYHWQQVLRLRPKIEDNRASVHSRKEYEAKLSTHMRAVQAMNGLFPVGDTAERDYTNGLRSRL